MNIRIARIAQQEFNDAREFVGCVPRTIKLGKDSSRGGLTPATAKTCWCVGRTLQDRDVNQRSGFSFVGCAHQKIDKTNNGGHSPFYIWINENRTAVIGDGFAF